MASKHSAYYNLRDALTQSTANATRTCPLCYLAAKAVASTLDNLLYELVNDPGVRQDIRQARGFCNRHAWQLPTIAGGAFGIAVIYRDVLETLLQSIQAIQPPGARRAQPLSLQRLHGMLGGAPFVQAAKSDLLAALEPQAECPACYQQRMSEQVYLGTLLEHLEDEELEVAFRASAGLCLPHFRQALSLIQDENTFSRLIEIELACLERLDGELNEFIRKHDYRLAQEGFGNEGDSWIRAIAQVSARKDVR